MLQYQTRIDGARIQLLTIKESTVLFMKKKQYENHTFYELVKVNLERKKSSKQEELIRLVSYNMIFLFWKIGNILNEIAINKLVFKDEAEIVSKISGGFSSIFGRYFDIKNISLMRQLAEKYSITTIRKIGPHIHWDHIQELMTLESDEELFFYIKLINEQSLNVNQLKDAISERVFLKENKKLGTHLSFIGLKMDPNFKRMLVVEYFSSSEGSAFYQLIGLDGISRSLPNLLVADEVLLRLSNNILSAIKEFQSTTDYFLNIYYNNMFWDFGNDILRLIEHKETIDIKKIEALANDLNGGNDIFFDKELLFDSISFANQYKIPGSQLDISRGINWEQIRVLLKLDDLSQQRFCAEKVVNERLSLEDLNEFIASNRLNSAHLKLERLEQQKIQIQNNQISKKNNVKLEVISNTVEDQELPDFNSSKSIFNNLAFCRFVTSF